MKWFLILIMVVLVGCGDDRGSRHKNMECDREEALRLARPWVAESNDRTIGSGSGEPGIRREHLCYDSSYPDTIAEWCWWELGDFNEDRCEYSKQCIVIPSRDVDRLRAERCAGDDKCEQAMNSATLMVNQANEMHEDWDSVVVHLCNLHHEDDPSVAGWCWWEVIEPEEPVCEAQFVCPIIPSEDVDRLRAERCN